MSRPKSALGVSRSQSLGVISFGDLSVVLPGPHSVRYLKLNNPRKSKCRFSNALKGKKVI